MLDTNQWSIDPTLQWIRGRLTACLTELVI